MGAVLALLPAAGHDQLWFLLMAERWLHGAALYGPQAFDSNTPAIIWLSAVPVEFAKAWDISTSVMAKLMMALLEVGVAGWACRILNRPPLHLSRAVHWFLAFMFVTVFAVVPARDFGQRDLIAALLCLPYVLAAANPGLPLSIRMGSILVAAVGICVKPQLSVLLLFVEATALLTARRRLPRIAFHFSALLFAAAGALFLLAIHHFAPLYFSQALPTTFLSYWAIGHLRPTELLAEALQLHLLLVAVLFLLRVVFRKNPSTQLRPAILVLTVAGLAGVASYYQQGTGWYYQQLPALVLLGAALALEFVALSELRSWTCPTWLPHAAAAFSLLSVTLTLHFSGYPITEDRAYAITSPDPSFFVSLPPGTAVATLTTSVDDAIEPVFRYKLTWAQRTDNLWMLPAILRATQPTPALPVPLRANASAIGLLAAEQRRWMVEDFTRWHPQVVLVARCESAEVHCQELEDRHDNLLAFFVADPAFHSIWQHYRALRSAGGYDAYVLTSAY